MSNIQTGAERMPHDLSHLGFLAGQIGRLITISTTPVIAGDSLDRKSGSAGMPRPNSYAVFCLKKKSALGAETFGEHLDDAIELLASKISVRPCTTDQFEKLRFLPILGGS